MNHSKKNTRLIVRKKHQQLIQLFWNDIQVPIYVSQFSAKLIRAFFNVADKYFQNLKFGLPDRTLYRSDRDIVMRLSILGLLNCYKRVLGLPVTAQFTPPKFPISEKGKVSVLCKKYSIIPEKTVILAPYSITLEQYNYEPLFENIAKVLQKNGYVVLTNTIDGRAIPGTVPFNADFNDTVTASQYVRWVISVRSGLCDLLYFSNCMLTVIYPLEIYQSIFSLEKTFGKKEKTDEIVLSPHATDISIFSDLYGDEFGAIVSVRKGNDVYECDAT
jgi:hypothetical protein